LTVVHKLHYAAAVRADAEELVELLIHLARRLREQERRCLERFGLSHQQARALWALKPGEPLSVRALAERIGADPSNVSTVIHGLEERDLVDRSAAANDRRRRALSLTKTGEEAREALVAWFEPPAVARLDPGERKRLLDLLRQIDRD